MESRIKEVFDTYLQLRERYDDRPDNWKELPGCNPDYFDDGEWEKLKTMDDGDEEAWLEMLKRKLSKAGLIIEVFPYNHLFFLKYLNIPIMVILLLTLGISKNHGLLLLMGYHRSSFPIPQYKTIMARIWLTILLISLTFCS